MPAYTYGVLVFSLFFCCVYFVWFCVVCVFLAFPEMQASVSDKPPRHQRRCPGDGSNPCSRYLSCLSTDPHPTSSRCRSNVCSISKPCSVCCLWSSEQWKSFANKQQYKRKPMLPSCEGFLSLLMVGVPIPSCSTSSLPKSPLSADVRLPQKFNLFLTKVFSHCWCQVTSEDHLQPCIKGNGQSTVIDVISGVSFLSELLFNK